MNLPPKQKTFWILVILVVNHLATGQDPATTDSTEDQHDPDGLLVRSEESENEAAEEGENEAAEEEGENSAAEEEGENSAAEENDNSVSEEQKEPSGAGEEKAEEPQSGKTSDETEEELQGRSFGFPRPRTIQDVLRERMNWVLNRYQLTPGGLPLPSVITNNNYYPEPQMKGGPDVTNVGVPLPAVGGNKWMPWTPSVHPWGRQMNPQPPYVPPPPMFPPQQHSFPGPPAHFAPSYDLGADIRIQPEVPQYLQPDVPQAPDMPRQHPPQQMLPPPAPFQTGQLPPMLPPPEQPLLPEQPLPMLPPPPAPYQSEQLPQMLPPPEQPLLPEQPLPMLPPPPPVQQHPPMLPQPPQQALLPPPQYPPMVENPMANPMDMRDVQRDVVEYPKAPVKTIRIKDIRNRKRSYPNCGQKPQHAKQLEQMEATQMGKFKERLLKRKKREEEEGPLWRVVSGEISVPDSWPWMSGIFSMREGKKEFFCGSSLISEWYVLTAAHCFDDVEGILNPEVYKVTLGHNIRWEGDTYDVEQVIIHPGYKKPQFYHDLTLMKTRRQIMLSQSVHPICLPSYTLPRIELMPQVDYLTFAGWGINHEEGDDPSVTLKELTVPVFPHDQCNKSYQVMLESFPNGITDHFICAGLQEGGKDTCKGDSGGPLVAELADNSWMQLGVLSSGYGCARAGFPGLYTKVADYLDWIYYNSDLMGGVFKIDRDE